MNMVTVGNGSGPMGAVTAGDYENGSGVNNPALTKGVTLEMRPIPKELTEALRAEFKRLIDGDDFLDNLVTLEALARTTRGLTMTIGVTTKAASPPQQGEMVAGGVWSGTTYVNPAGPPMSLTKNPEQFGARAIRELVTLVPEIAAKVAQSLRQSPANLVEAIHSAREKGLTALAEKLEAKLLDGADEVEPATPRGAHDEDHPHTNGVAAAAGAT